MLITPVLYVRSLSGAPLPLPPALSFTVQSYANAAIGGPTTSSIVVNGPVDSLVQALNWLRCPVQLFDARQRIVWLGWISDISLALGAISIGASLDPMGNSVRVAYALTGGSNAGTRATTASATDADSIAEYGTKELTISLGDGSASQAEQLRDVVLSQRRYPAATPGLADRSAEASVTLTGRGWWDTLGWKNFNSAIKGESYDPGAPPPDRRNIGNDYTKIRWAQRFTLPDATDSWNIESVDLTIEIQTLASVSLNVGIYSDSGGAPDTLIGSEASYDVTALELNRYGDNNNTAWVRFTLPSPVAITGGTYYHVVVRNAGDAQTGGDAHGIKCDVGAFPDAYARGYISRYNGPGTPTWSVDDDANSDLPFKLNGVLETSEQVKRIVSVSGQFLTACDVLTASGVYSSAYRAGDLTALAEIEALLKAGSTSDVRILATITPARRVQLYAEPAATVIANYIDAQGNLYDASRNPVGAELCPAGIWCGLLDVLPQSVNLSRLAPVNPFFVESASVDVRSGRWRPQPRNIDSPFRVGVT